MSYIFDGKDEFIAEIMQEFRGRKAYTLNFGESKAWPRIISKTREFLQGMDLNEESSLKGFDKKAYRELLKEEIFSNPEFSELFILNMDNSRIMTPREMDANSRNIRKTITPSPTMNIIEAATWNMAHIIEKELQKAWELASLGLDTNFA